MKKISEEAINMAYVFHILLALLLIIGGGSIIGGMNEILPDDNRRLIAEKLSFLVLIATPYILYVTISHWKRHHLTALFILMIVAFIIQDIRLSLAYLVTGLIVLGKYSITE